MMPVRFGAIFQISKPGGMESVKQARELAKEKNGAYLPPYLVLTDIHKNLAEHYTGASQTALNLGVCDSGLTSELPLNNYLTKLNKVFYELLNRSIDQNLPEEPMEPLEEVQITDGGKGDGDRVKERIKFHLLKLADLCDKLAPDLKEGFIKLSKYKMLK